MKSDALLDAIGEAKDEYVLDVRKSKDTQKRPWGKWGAAIAACLALALGLNAFFGNLGANTGTGGDTDLNYMRYVGPVLPLTVRGDASGITAVRNVEFDFSGYHSRQYSYEEDNGEIAYYQKYESEALVTDSYTLTNASGEDKTFTLLYPFTGDMRQWQYHPTISVNGETVPTVMYPGPYVGGFAGAWGSDEPGTLNLAPPECFADYRGLLSTEDYRNAAFAPFPVLEQKVYVYRLHNFIYSADEEAKNPTLCFDFYMDYGETFVFTYGFNGAAVDPESGYCSRRKGGISYRPNVAPERQHPEDGYLILMGADLEEYTLQGYRDGGCDQGEELSDLGCAVTRYETTLGEVMSALLDDFLEEVFPKMDSVVTGEVSLKDMPARELYLGLAAELLSSYGIIGGTPMERYSDGRLEDCFSEAISQNRVIYLSFDATVPAGDSITLEAVMRKDNSVDFVGNDKGKDGYDMATKLGSNLTFTEQTASICGFEEIEILGQNFGFDPENGITKVPLNLNQEHYWLQVSKLREE